MAIGQLSIDVPGPIKSAFFLLFLFAVGYGVGPQFFRGLGKDGPRQILFSLIVLAFCLLVPYVCARIAGLDMGYAVGLYAGSQTISASIGVATDQIRRGLGLDPDTLKTYMGAIPVGYAVSYIFGTIGSAIVLAQLGPKLTRRRPSSGVRGVREAAGRRHHRASTREFSAYRAGRGACLPDRRRQRSHRQARARDFPGAEGLRRARAPRRPICIEADADTVLEPGDVVSISGPREYLVEQVESVVPEVEDRGPARHAGDDGGRLRSEQGRERQTLRQLADEPLARGIYLRKITRNLVELPMLPETEILRGDVLTFGGSTRHVDAAVKAIGHADRPVEATDLAVVAAGILIGGLIGALSYLGGRRADQPVDLGWRAAGRTAARLLPRDPARPSAASRRRRCG